MLSRDRRIEASVHVFYNELYGNRVMRKYTKD